MKFLRRRFATAIGLVLLIATDLHAGERVDLRKLHDACVPRAPFSTLIAIVGAESDGNPNAIQLDYPQRILHNWRLPKGSLRFERQPHHAAEAISWATALAKQGIAVDLGLMQLSTTEANRRGIRIPELLDPCTNLRVGWGIFRDDYHLSSQKYGHTQEAVWHALSRYNTGSDEAGIANGYLTHVMHSLVRQSRALEQLTEAEAERWPGAGRNYTQHDRGSSQ